MKSPCLVLALFSASAGLLLARGEKPDEIAAANAAATIVVFNRNDDTSADLARFYADRRGIATDHLVGLDCSPNEEISREEYDRTIAQPLRRALAQHGWWIFEKRPDGTSRLTSSSVHFVALIRGLPLKIASVPIYEGDQQGTGLVGVKNEASVDSELAGLGFFLRVISGAQVNPYFRSFKRILEENLPALLLVARLDAPTAAQVRRMITDSIEAEKKGLWGFTYIDSRGIKDGALAEGDQWLDRIKQKARERGQPVIADNGPEMFPAAYPIRNAAEYYGWYAQNVAPPFSDENFRFNPGAIACHIHSYSATTLRDPQIGWAAPLLAHGAAATLGNVYEPFLSLTTNLEIFHERLGAGFTFAESASMGTKGWSWMNTFVGDPLYRPFRIFQEISAQFSDAPVDFAAYREGALVWFHESHNAGAKKLQQSGRQLRSGLVFEGLGLLQADDRDAAGALISFQQARAFYRQKEDVLRVAIHEVSLLRAENRAVDALALARRQIALFPDAHAADVLRGIVNQLDPPATPMPTKNP